VMVAVLQCAGRFISDLVAVLLHCLSGSDVDGKQKMSKGLECYVQVSLKSKIQCGCGP
jgi:hypothetical protein